MKKMEQMHLLLYLLDRLKHNSREQVHMSKIPECFEILSKLIQRSDDDIYKTKLSDIYEALDEVSKLNTENLPSSIKEVLINNLFEAKILLATDLFNYYSVMDFDINEDTIRVMREVVQTALENNDNI